MQRNYVYCNHSEKKYEKSYVSGIFFVLLYSKF